VTTAIVTDSTTSLAPGVLERPDVRVVPLTFHFGEDETYTDKVDMTNEEFYERLRDSDVFPTTARTTRPCRRRGWLTGLSTYSMPRAPRWGLV
jgi:fatty acid-binding protein DegV